MCVHVASSGFSSKWINVVFTMANVVTGVRFPVVVEPDALPLSCTRSLLFSLSNPPPPSPPASVFLLLSISLPYRVRSQPLEQAGSKHSLISPSPMQTDSPSSLLLASQTNTHDVTALFQHSLTAPAYSPLYVHTQEHKNIPSTYTSTRTHWSSTQSCTRSSVL